MKVKLTNPALDKGKGSLRVYRGGDWYFDAGLARASYRSYDDPYLRLNNLGFRLVRNKD